MQELRRNLNRKPCDQPDVGNAQGLWRKEGGDEYCNIFEKFATLGGGGFQKHDQFLGCGDFCG